MKFRLRSTQRSVSLTQSMDSKPLSIPNTLSMWRRAIFYKFFYPHDFHIESRNTLPSCITHRPLSTYGAPGTKLKLPSTLRTGVRPLYLSYRNIHSLPLNLAELIWRGVIFDKFRTPVTVGKNTENQNQTKKMRTDGHSRRF